MAPTRGTGIISASASYNSYSLLYRYLSQGAPTILGTSLPLLFILPCLRRASSTLGLLALGGWIILAYSLLAHKEFRFIMSVVPIASILAGNFDCISVFFV